jgi:hypothetical protein
MCIIFHFCIYIVNNTLQINVKEKGYLINNKNSQLAFYEKQYGNLEVYLTP